MLGASQGTMNIFPWSTRLLILFGRGKHPLKSLLVTKVSKSSIAIGDIYFFLGTFYLLKAILFKFIYSPLASNSGCTRELALSSSFCNCTILLGNPSKICYMFPSKLVEPP